MSKVHGKRVFKNEKKLVEFKRYLHLIRIHKICETIRANKIECVGR